HMHVCAGGDHDHVPPLAVDADGRDAGRLTWIYANVGDVDVLPPEAVDQLPPKGILAHPAEHRHLRPEPGGGHRLVGSFAAGEGRKGPPGHRLADPGKTRSLDHEIHVEAADDADLHPATCTVGRIGILLSIAMNHYSEG